MAQHDRPRTETRTLEPQDYFSAVRRTSWGAVIAGVVAAMGLQLLLTALGTAIGLSTLYASLDEGDPARGIGVGAGLWWLITGTISLFIGGWVAGRLSGVLRHRDGALHGFVTWGTTTLLALFLTTTALGHLVSGTMTSLQSASGGQGQRLLGMPVSDAAGTAWESFYQDVQQNLSQQENIDASARREVMNVVREEFRAGNASVDQERLISTLTAQANLSESQAREWVDRWQRMWQQRGGGSQQTQAGQNESGRQDQQQTAETTRQLVSASWWAFAGLLLGAIASFAGGYLGTPTEPPMPRVEATTIRRE